MKIKTAILAVVSAFPAFPAAADTFSLSYGCTGYIQTDNGCRSFFRGGLDFGIKSNWYMGLGLAKEGKFNYDGYLLEVRGGRFFSSDGRYSFRTELGVEFGIPSAAYANFDYTTDGKGRVLKQAWRSIEQNGKLPFFDEYHDVNMATVTHPFIGAGMRRKMGRKFFAETGIRISFGPGQIKEAAFDEVAGHLTTRRDVSFIAILPRFYLGFGIKY